MAAVVVKAFASNQDRVLGRDPISGIEARVTALKFLDSEVDEILDRYPDSYVWFFRADGTGMNYHEAVEELKKLETIQEQELTRDEYMETFQEGVLEVED